MATATLRFDGGVAGVLAGVLLPLGHLLNLGGDPATGTGLGKALVLAGHTVLVFAFVGIYARQTAHSSRPVARAGMIASVVGTVLVAAIVYVELAGAAGVDTTPVFAAAGAALVYAVGPLLFVLGMLLVGGSVVRGASLPRRSGWLLVVGTLVFAAAGGAGDAAPAVTVVGAAITGGGFVWAGADLLAPTTAADARPA